MIASQPAYKALGRALLIGVALALVSFSSLATLRTVAMDELKPWPAHKRATRLITHFIANYHYKKAVLDDDLSAAILARYIDLLDPTKSYFLRSDIDEFNTHVNRLDDYLRNSNLDEPFDIFKRYRRRVDERVAYAIARVERDFDFDRNERFKFDRDNAPWAESAAELDELWRKRVKNDVLSLRLAGKKPAKLRDTLRKRYEGIQRRTSQLNSEDVFQMFINAYTTSIDPHTAYFSPRTSENFKIRMSLSLEGIGAVLQSESEYTLVRQVVPGGPADKSGKLHADDRIVGIGQDAHGELVDVIGWRLDDVVDLIRGPKDSVVRLEIVPKGTGVDGPTKLISIVRNKIRLEEQAAKKSIIDVPDDTGPMRIGVIEVPTFYMDFEARSRGDADYRSTTRDVRALLEELAEENIAGLIIDLRGDGGGSLSEATDLTGLFIDYGPVVQVRNSQGRVQLERDADRGAAYEGPLAVLVDRNSASASEIFAGAIQDYRRGLVIGEPTFGKGTVQNLVDLNRFDDSMKGQLGQLKATIAQFYRVAGGSTQYKGVVPDIVFPTAHGSDDHGERALDNALPWDRIAAARFKPVAGPLDTIETIRRQHENRVAVDVAFQTLLEQEQAIIEAREKSEVSLLEGKRKIEYDDAKRKQHERRNQMRIAHGLEALPFEEVTDDDAAEEDTLAEAISDDKDEDETFDVILDESGRILRDFVNATQPDRRLVDTDTGVTGSTLSVPTRTVRRIDARVE